MFVKMNIEYFSTINKIDIRKSVLGTYVTILSYVI